MDQWNFDKMLSEIRHSDNRIVGLDFLQIMNGLHFFKQKIHIKFGSSPIVVHANYFVSTDEKIKQLKANNLWYNSILTFKRY